MYRSCALNNKSKYNERHNTRHYIAEILLKVAFNINQSINERHTNFYELNFSVLLVLMVFYIQIIYFTPDRVCKSTLPVWKLYCKHKYTSENSKDEVKNGQSRETAKKTQDDGKQNKTTLCGNKHK